MSLWTSFATTSSGTSPPLCYPSPSDAGTPLYDGAPACPALLVTSSRRESASQAGQTAQSRQAVGLLSDAFDTGLSTAIEFPVARLPDGSVAAAAAQVQGVVVDARVSHGWIYFGDSGQRRLYRQRLPADLDTAAAADASAVSAPELVADLALPAVAGTRRGVAGGGWARIEFVAVDVGELGGSAAFVSDASGMGARGAVWRVSLPASDDLAAPGLGAADAATDVSVIHRSRTPAGLAVDSAHAHLYVADTAAGTVTRLSTATGDAAAAAAAPGAATVVVLANLEAPRGVAFDVETAILVVAEASPTIGGGGRVVAAQIDVDTGAVLSGGGAATNVAGGASPDASLQLLSGAAMRHAPVTAGVDSLVGGPAGAVYVSTSPLVTSVRAGPAALTVSHDSTTDDGAIGHMAAGTAFANARLGGSGNGVCAVADVNGDGVADAVVGTEHYPAAGASATGSVSVLWLNADGGVDGQQNVNNDVGGLGAAGVTLVAGDRFGAAVADAGDLNNGVGDATMYSELLVGAPGRSSSRGAVFVLFLTIGGYVDAAHEIGDGGAGGLPSNTLPDGAEFGAAIARVESLDALPADEASSGGTIAVAVAATGDEPTNGGTVYIVHIDRDDGAYASHVRLAAGSASAAAGLPGGAVANGALMGSALAPLAALHGLAAGAPGEDSVYVFRFTDNDATLGTGGAGGLASHTRLDHAGVAASTGLVGSVTAWGSGLAAAPDVDGNGVAELIVGSASSTVDVLFLAASLQAGELSGTGVDWLVDAADGIRARAAVRLTPSDVGVHPGFAAWGGSAAWGSSISFLGDVHGGDGTLELLTSSPAAGGGAGGVHVWSIEVVDTTDPAGAGTDTTPTLVRLDASAEALQAGATLSAPVELATSASAGRALAVVTARCADACSGAGCWTSSPAGCLPSTVSPACASGYTAVPVHGASGGDSHNMACCPPPAPESDASASYFVWTDEDAGEWECRECAPECSACDGPGAADCLACPGGRWYDASLSTGVACPLHSVCHPTRQRFVAQPTPTSDRVCEDCHSTCAYSCTGPLPTDCIVRVYVEQEFGGAIAALTLEDGAATSTQPAAVSAPLTAAASTLNWVGRTLAPSGAATPRTRAMAADTRSSHMALYFADLPTLSVRRVSIAHDADAAQEAEVVAAFAGASPAFDQTLAGDLAQMVLDVSQGVGFVSDPVGVKGPYPLQPAVLRFTLPEAPLDLEAGPAAAPAVGAGVERWASDVLADIRPYGLALDPRPASQHLYLADAHTGVVTRVSSVDGSGAVSIMVAPSAASLAFSPLTNVLSVVTSPNDGASGSVRIAEVAADGSIVGTDLVADNSLSDGAAIAQSDSAGDAQAQGDNVLVSTSPGLPTLRVDETWIEWSAAYAGDTIPATPTGRSGSVGENGWGNKVVHVGDVDANGYGDIVLTDWRDSAVWVVFMDADFEATGQYAKLDSSNGGVSSISNIGDALTAYWGTDAWAMGDWGDGSGGDPDGIPDICVTSHGYNTHGVDNNMGAFVCIFLDSDGTAKGGHVMADGVDGGLPFGTVLPDFGSGCEFTGCGNAWSTGGTTLPDLDGDGYPEVAAGCFACEGDGSGSHAGAVHVIFMQPLTFRYRAHFEIHNGFHGFSPPMFQAGSGFGFMRPLPAGPDNNGLRVIMPAANLNDAGGNGAYYFLQLGADDPYSVVATTQVSNSYGGLAEAGGAIALGDGWGETVVLDDLDADGTPEFIVSAPTAASKYFDLIYSAYDGTVRALIRYSTSNGRLPAAYGLIVDAFSRMHAIPGSVVPTRAYGDAAGGTYLLGFSAYEDNAAMWLRLHIDRGGDDDIASIVDAGGDPWVEVSAGTHSSIVAATDSFSGVGGTAITAAGDYNADGVADMVIGSPVGEGTAGKITVVFLGTDDSVVGSQAIYHSASQGGGLVQAGGSLTAGDRFGTAVVSVGDLAPTGEEDGFVDLLACAAPTSGYGFCYVLFMAAGGTVDRLHVVDEKEVDLQDGAQFGSSAAYLGDYDMAGDTAADGPSRVVAVGQPYYNHAANPHAETGSVLLLALSPADGSVVASTHIDSPLPTTDGQRWGSSLAALSVDHDGFTDLAVSAPWNDEASVGTAGSFHVVLLAPSSTPGTVADVSFTTQLRPDTHEVLTSGLHKLGGVLTDDQMGHSLVSIADLDGDGVDELAFALGAQNNRPVIVIMSLRVVRGADGSTVEAVVPRKTSVYGPTLGNLPADLTARLAVDEAWAHGSMADLGDKDGDGYVTLAIGARLDSAGGTAGFAGAVYLVELRAADVPQVLRVDASASALQEGTASATLLVHESPNVGRGVAVVFSECHDGCAAGCNAAGAAGCLPDDGSPACALNFAAQAAVGGGTACCPVVPREGGGTVPTYAELDEATGEVTCVVCHATCASCAGPTASQCLSCVNGYWLDDQGPLCRPVTPACAAHSGAVWRQLSAPTATTDRVCGWRPAQAPADANDLAVARGFDGPALSRGRSMAWGDSALAGYETSVYVVECCGGGGASDNRVLLSDTVSGGDGAFTAADASTLGIADGGEGGVAAFIDVDLDSVPELLVANHGDAPNRLFAAVSPVGGQVVTEYADVAAQWAFGDTGHGGVGGGQATHIAPGDCDADGDVDVLVSMGGGRPSRLFVNDGGTVFAPDPADAAVAAGIDDTNGHTVAALWFDFDGDGDLDVVQVSAVAGPAVLGGAVRLLVNTGDGSSCASFDDVTVAAGLGDAVATDPDGDGNGGGGVPSVLFGDHQLAGAALIDADNDGDADLYVVCATCDNALFINNNDGTFVLDTDPGAALSALSASRVKWGATAADIDDDGDDDLVVATSTGVTVLRNLLIGGDVCAPVPHASGSAVFEDATADLAMTGPLTGGPVVAVGAVDADRDGDVDVFGLVDGAPNILYVAPGSPGGVATLTVRVLHRAGSAAAMHGSHVLLRAHSADPTAAGPVVAAAQIVGASGAGGSGGSTTPTGVRFAVCRDTLYDVEALPVGHVVGAALTSRVQPALGGVTAPSSSSAEGVDARDDVIVETVSVVPSDGVLRVGDNLTVTLAALNGEAGLLLTPASQLVGVDNSDGALSALLDGSVADGSYTVRYTLASGGADWAHGELPMALVLADAAGHESSVVTMPADVTVRGDQNLPVAAFDSTPPVYTRDTTASFTLACSELNCTYHYQLDVAAADAATTAWVVVGGAVDGGGAGDVGAAGLAPSVAIVSGPARTSSSTAADFELALDEPAGGGGGGPSPGIEWQVVAGALPHGAPLALFDVWDSLAPGASVLSLTDLDEGQYTLFARSGPGDALPVAHTWTVDVTPPVLDIVAGPVDGEVRTSTHAAFAFLSSESVVRFRYRVTAADDASAEFVPWTDTLAHSVHIDGDALPDGGGYTFELDADDWAGNTAAAVATRSWTIAPCDPVPDVTITTVHAPHPDPALSGGAAHVLMAASDAPLIEYRVLTVDGDGNTDADSVAWTAREPGEVILPQPHDNSLAGVTQVFEARAVVGCVPHSPEPPDPATYTWTHALDPRADVLSVTVVDGPNPVTTLPVATFAVAVEGRDDPSGAAPAPSGAASGAAGHFLECAHGWAPLTDGDVVYTYVGGGSGGADPAWRSCGAHFAVGPVPTGHQRLLVRAIDATTGAVDPRAPNDGVTTWDWSLAPGSNAALDLAGLDSGVHTLRLRATDSALNVQTPGTEVEFDWEVDREPPQTVLSLVTPDPTRHLTSTFAVSCDGEVNAQDCTFCWTAEAPPFAGIGGVGVVHSGCTTAGDATFDVVFGALDGPDGVYSVSVVAVDGTGNEDLSPATLTWTLDTQAPVLQVLAPPGSQLHPDAAHVGWVVNGTTPTVVVKASEAVSAVHVAVETLAVAETAPGSGTFVVDATVVETIDTVADGGGGDATERATVTVGESVGAPALAHGTVIRVTATVSDLAGNAAAEPAVMVLTIDTQAPALVTPADTRIRRQQSTSR